MKKIFTLLFCGFAFVAANAQSVDYEMVAFLSDTSQSASMITEINLGPNDNLNPIYLLKNNGPDVIAPADTLYTDITIEGQAFGSMYIPGSYLQDFTSEMSIVMYGDQPLATAAQIDQIMTYFNITSGQFNLCYEVRIGGVSTDPVPTNNKQCVVVKRGNVGIDGFNAEEINVYPNPATNVINVANAENAQVSVFDINGKLMVSVESASANQTIDASNFANGLYFVRITDGNNVVTKKINVVK